MVARVVLQMYVNTYYCSSSGYIQYAIYDNCRVYSIDMFWGKLTVNQTFVSNVYLAAPGLVPVA